MRFDVLHSNRCIITKADCNILHKTNDENLNNINSAPKPLGRIVTEAWVTIDDDCAVPHAINTYMSSRYKNLYLPSSFRTGTLAHWS